MVLDLARDYFDFREDGNLKVNLSTFLNHLQKIEVKIPFNYGKQS